MCTLFGGTTHLTLLELVERSASQICRVNSGPFTPWQCCNTFFCKISETSIMHLASWLLSKLYRTMVHAPTITCSPNVPNSRLFYERHVVQFDWTDLEWLLLQSWHRFLGKISQIALALCQGWNMRSISHGQIATFGMRKKYVIFPQKLA